MRPAIGKIPPNFAKILYRKIYYIPVASDELEGELSKLPEVVSGDLAMLVVIGQGHGRHLPEIQK